MDYIISFHIIPPTKHIRLPSILLGFGNFVYIHSAFHKNCSTQIHMTTFSMHIETSDPGPTSLHITIAIKTKITSTSSKKLKCPKSYGDWRAQLKVEITTQLCMECSLGLMWDKHDYHDGNMFSTSIPMCNQYLIFYIFNLHVPS